MVYGTIWVRVARWKNKMAARIQDGSQFLAFFGITPHYVSSNSCKSFVFGINLKVSVYGTIFVRVATLSKQNGCQNSRWQPFSSFFSHYPLLFQFKLMQQFRFRYQFEGKGLWNNLVRVAPLSKQNGHQNLKWLPISSFFSHYAS